MPSLPFSKSKRRFPMRTRKLLVPFAALGCFLLAAGAASAQNAQSNVTVTYPAGFAVSTPASQTRQPALPIASATALPNGQTIIPLRLLPRAGGGALAPSLLDQMLQ